MLWVTFLCKSFLHLSSLLLQNGWNWVTETLLFSGTGKFQQCDSLLLFLLIRKLLVPAITFIFLWESMMAVKNTFLAKQKTRGIDYPMGTDALLSGKGDIYLTNLSLLVGPFPEAPWASRELRWFLLPLCTLPNELANWFHLSGFSLD